MLPFLKKGDPTWSKDDFILVQFKNTRALMASRSSDGSGIPEIGFSGTRNQPKNGFKAS